MSDLYNSIEELMLELEDEDGDPLGGRTLAIVPGAFKPPHLGHLSMVKQYVSQSRSGGKPWSASSISQIFFESWADIALPATPLLALRGEEIRTTTSSA